MIGKLISKCFSYRNCSPRKTARLVQTSEKIKENGSLCKLSDISIISAVFSNKMEKMEKYAEIAGDTEGIFRCAGATREERLQKLAAFRAKQTCRESNFVNQDSVPEWARGRLAASSCLPESLPGLPDSVKKIVDSAISVRPENPGKAFGSWLSPVGIQFTHPFSGDYQKRLGNNGVQ